MSGEWHRRPTRVIPSSKASDGSGHAAYSAKSLRPCFMMKVADKIQKMTYRMRGLVIRGLKHAIVIRTKSHSHPEGHVLTVKRGGDKRTFIRDKTTWEGLYPKYDSIGLEGSKGE